jgi:hypothetical protein
LVLDLGQSVHLQEAYFERREAIGPGIPLPVNPPPRYIELADNRKMGTNIPIPISKRIVTKPKDCLHRVTHYACRKDVGNVINDGVLED